MGGEESRVFVREGASVVLTDRVEDDGEDLASRLQKDGGQVTFVLADVALEEDWRRIVSTALELYGRIDVLANNAGVSSSIAEEFDVDGWDSVMSVNALSVFLSMREVLPHMVKQGSGSIINVSSIAAKAGMKHGHLAYSCSKAGVSAMTRTIAARYGKRGIRANAILPGAMPTMRTKRLSPESTGLQDAVIDACPLGRVGVAADIANAALYLASDESAYVTGIELVVDGGYLAV